MVVALSLALLLGSSSSGFIMPSIIFLRRLMWQNYSKEREPLSRSSLAFSLPPILTFWSFTRAPDVKSLKKLYTSPVLGVHVPEVVFEPSPDPPNPIGFFF
jgi:hypothetical protein